MMRASIDGNAGVSNTPQIGSTPMPAATSHTVALIRMGEDGKITYGGDKVWIRELIAKLVNA